MDVLIIIGGAQALFLAVLVISKRSRTSADLALAAILLASFGAFLCVYLAYGVGWTGALLFTLHGNLLLAPLFYIYVSWSTEPSRGWRQAIPHLLPFLAGSLYTLATVVALPEPDIETLFAASFPDRPIVLNAFYLADLAAVPVYLPWALWRLRRHRHRVDTIFSYHEDVDLAWMRVLIVVMAVTWLAVELPLFSSEHLGWPTERTSLRLGFALSAVSVFLLGYFGFRQSQVFTGPRATPPASTAPAAGRYRKSGLPADEAGRAADRLRELMRAEKPFLDKALSILELGGRVSLPTHNLSQVLNEEIGESFYDFVNRHRVEEVRRRLTEGGSRLTLLDIALESGFSSKTSFNRVFKRVTGQTPSQFARAVRS